MKYLDCLWAQICNLRSNKWREKQIVRPYLAFDGVLCDALQHTLPQIIPPSHNEEMVYPLPRVIFRLFDYTDVPEVSVQTVCLFLLIGVQEKQKKLNQCKKFLQTKSYFQNRPVFSKQFVLLYICRV